MDQNILGEEIFIIILCAKEGIKNANDEITKVIETAKKQDYILVLENERERKDGWLKLAVGEIRRYPGVLIAKSGVKIDWSRGKVSQTKTDPNASPLWSTLIPVKAFKRCGILEENLPLELAGYEFTWRAHQAGFKLAVLPLKDKSLTKVWLFPPPVARKLSYIEAVKMIVDRKMLNSCFNWKKFVDLACPGEFRTANRKYMQKLIVDILFSTSLIRFSLKIRLMLHQAKLFLIQFPEYHLYKK